MQANEEPGATFAVIAHNDRLAVPVVEELF
jgi:hypothetical protein